MFVKRKLRNALNYYRYHLPVLDWLIGTFELNNYTYALVGGFVKNIVAYDMSYRKYSSESRDLDIIVDVPRTELEYLLRYYRIKNVKNDFGGFKIIDRYQATFNIDIDIWCLEDHQPFKALPKKYHNWKGIRKSGWLSLCGGTWLPQTNKLYIKGLRKAIRTKKIKMYNPDYYFNSNQVVNKYTVVAKLIDYKQHEYTLDKNCRSAVDTYLNNHTKIDSLVRYLEDHSDLVFSDWRQIIEDMRH